MIKNFLYLIVFFTTYALSITNKKDFYRSFQIDDNLLLKRCELQFCANTTTENCNLVKCVELMMDVHKFGNCPTEPSRIESMCIKTCDKSDYQCPGILKCCQHSCGRTCQQPEGLNTVSNRILPPIPYNVSLYNMENHPKSRRKAEISWQMDWYGENDDRIFYILEGRAHNGFHFSEHKLTTWFAINIDITIKETATYIVPSLSRTRLAGEIRLHPGKWYVFRVAAANANGIRGYSPESEPFQLNEIPRNPPPPRNFTVTIMLDQTNSKTVIYAKATWKHPKTDYPVEKYKISWSLYLAESTTNGSLWLNEAYVQEPIRFYEIWNLKPNSLHYIQLQALSTFGRKRLKSPKEALFINTTIPGHIFAVNQQTKPNLLVRYVSSKKHGLIARILWPEQFHGGTVEICAGTLDCLGKQPISDYKMVRAKSNHFDFLNLKYETRYSVRLKSLTGQTIKKNFKTPICKHFVRRHPQLGLKCL